MMAWMRSRMRSAAIMVGMMAIAANFVAVMATQGVAPPDSFTAATTAHSDTINNDRHNYDTASIQTGTWKEQDEILFDLDIDSDLDVAVDGENSTCATIFDCKACTNTYTCHWCDADDACHARGSVHGCVWGSDCKAKPGPKPKPAPKENTTCASHNTCSECALASHLCHWCEFDNACHAVGSPYGCSIGVDCYSNDRCRRDKPQKLDKFIITDMPLWAMGCVIGVASALIGFITCCYCCMGEVKGSYDELATMTVAASVAPLSVIGGPTFRPSEFQSNLQTHAEGDEDEDEHSTAAADGTPDVHEQINDEEQPLHPSPSDNAEAAAAAQSEASEGGKEQASKQQSQQQQQQEQEQPESEGVCPPIQDALSTPLLPATSSANIDAFDSNNPQDLYAMADMDPPTHMGRLYQFCSYFYYVAVAFIVLLAIVVIYLYPIIPDYNVCNDAVAWSGIISQIVSFHLGASFEILISIKNVNHVNVVLDKGSGVFRYDNAQVGTFTIPPAYSAAMSITDIMIIAKLEPDKFQALQIVADYHAGKLVLDADFTADLRVPGIFNFGLKYQDKGFVIDISQISDRSLCHCPTWGADSTEPLRFLELDYN